MDSSLGCLRCLRRDLKLPFRDTRPLERDRDLDRNPCVRGSQSLRSATEADLEVILPRSVPRTEHRQLERMPTTCGLSLLWKNEEKVFHE